MDTTSLVFLHKNAKPILHNISQAFWSGVMWTDVSAEANSLGPGGGLLFNILNILLFKLSWVFLTNLHYTLCPINIFFRKSTDRFLSSERRKIK